MTLKAKCGMAILAVAVVIALLPTPAIDAIYKHVYLEASTVLQWVLPIIVAVLSFLLLRDWFKALIAGAVSFGITLFMFGLMGIGGLDCSSETIVLSRSCDGDSLAYAKVGFASLICLNLFLLYRIAFPKASRTSGTVQTK